MSIPASHLYGNLPVVLSRSESIGGPGELDGATARVLCPYPGWPDALRESGYSVGRAVAGYHAMFVSGIRIDSIDGATCEVEVSSSGLAGGDEKRLRRISSGSQQVAVGPLEKVILVWDRDERGQDAETGAQVEKVKRAVPKLDAEGQPVYLSIATPSGTGERWNVMEAIVTVSDTYFSRTAPVTSGVGRAGTPPNPPATPPYLWGGYDRPLRFQHPNGWVLESREAEQVAATLWRVTDTWGFHQAAVPD